MGSGNTRWPLAAAAIAAVIAYHFVGPSSPLDLFRLGHHAPAIAARITIDDSDDAKEGAAKTAVKAANRSVQRSVGDFDSIALNDGVTATITIGDARSLTVDAPAYLLDSVSTRVENGRLIVDGSPTVTVRITVPHLKALTIDGPGRVDLQGLRDPIAITADGPAGITASGHVASLDVSISGPGTVSLAKLEAQVVHVVIDGPGAADIFATDTLVADIRGSGHLRYLGVPRLTTNVDGAGSIKPLPKDQA